jgi:hypothetical protein
MNASGSMLLTVADGPIHASVQKGLSQKLIPVGSPLRSQRPLPGLLMDTLSYFPDDEFFGVLRPK